jgi:hypothetical protein
VTRSWTPSADGGAAGGVGWFIHQIRAAGRLAA